MMEQPVLCNGECQFAAPWPSREGGWIACRIIAGDNPAMWVPPGSSCPDARHAAIVAEARRRCTADRKEFAAEIVAQVEALLCSCELVEAPGIEAVLRTLRGDTT